PAAIRCGCFLPDLTRLADANVHPTPERAYGGHRFVLQLAEVVRVGLEHQPLRRRIMYDGVDAVLFRISDGCLPARETQAELAAGIPAARPAHQRVGLARLGGNEIEHPLVGECLAGLHGVFRTLEDTGLHAEPFVRNGDGIKTSRHPSHRRGALFRTRSWS